MPWYWTDDIAELLKESGTITDCDAERIGASPVAFRMRGEEEPGTDGGDPDEDVRTLVA